MCKSDSCDSPHGHPIIRHPWLSWTYSECLQMGHCMMRPCLTKMVILFLSDRCCRGCLGFGLSPRREPRLPLGVNRYSVETPFIGLGRAHA